MKASTRKIIIKQAHAKIPKILLFMWLFFFFLFWQQRSFRRANGSTPSKITSIIMKRTRQRCLAVSISNTFYTYYRKQVSITMHKANVNEKIALFSHTLLRSYSENRALDKNICESQLDAENTAALTRIGDQSIFVSSRRFALLSIYFFKINLNLYKHNLL